ncbi:MAG: ribosomal RNA small subunit methyltransferase A [Candidatus Latescibacteria bacterium]|nr:ribosomal RNA small subunit methyltransferase A [Candidatus Latescibacterota bacterium]NIM22623.1 ribosomal RNA small subunit methyltransferase A [Candidatus Latescibacterota bacterium]NIM64912.1 ribosomal RNA small subunit methyltransferase A [Candidatus Latescibacterota bacterium]NIO01427.1 ribosomal RNA small subunit methyltransferase A [Candidatus Latescibacterota bacterium]NIO27937.1 ribosomal RNA small subunit methyltransferase A [Candidatus Latescibacterota bacterium]
MKRKDFRPKKRFGQHFLYDPAIAAKIVDASGVGQEDTVVELGAGKGILTKPLSERDARIIALEVDRTLCEELARQFEGNGDGHDRAAAKVEVLNVDFTKISLTGLLAARNLERCVLMGNIPYNLTREVLFSFLVDEYEIIESAFLMLQKEVGDRIVSPPGSRVYGITSVILQSFYSIQPVLKVAPGSFSPRPKVASVVLSFKPLPEPLVEPGELKQFIGLVKNLFQQRRKTIHNTLKTAYELPEMALKKIHAATGINLQRRPEELSNLAFLQISRSLAEVTKV